MASESNSSDFNVVASRPKRQASKSSGTLGSLSRRTPGKSGIGLASAAAVARIVSPAIMHSASRTPQKPAEVATLATPQTMNIDMPSAINQPLAVSTAAPLQQVDLESPTIEVGITFGVANTTAPPDRQSLQDSNHGDGDSAMK